MGSDFSAEDFTGRHVTKDQHSMIGETEVRLSSQKDHLRYRVWVIESYPKGFEGKTLKMKTWVDQQTYLPLKIEFYNHNSEVYKQYEAQSIKIIDGYPTITKKIMTSPLEGTRTILFHDEKNTRYNIGIPASVFDEESLKNPPEQYLQVD